MQPKYNVAATLEKNVAVTLEKNVGETFIYTIVTTKLQRLMKRPGNVLYATLWQRSVMVADVVCCRRYDLNITLQQRSHNV
ncbi:hypothetical protein DPMN_072786 [Dreissena polymorpha]|uniref:Uncharacterized protein n=1 Tax=Dreissena polymorpha TaxID=45954 RepID=A0A9D4HC86_DREPO|nr:hypothetical protein DPMN_072786 [Dreissena polymorpha]